MTWQKERKTNAGVDFSFLKGLISGTVDLFENYRYDILRNRQTVPLYFGVSTVPPVNIGKVSNRGFEVELAHKWHIGQLAYNVKATFSYAKNKIVEIDEPPAKYPWLRQTGTSIGTTRMYVWDGFYLDQKDIDTSANPSGTIRPGYLKYRDLNGDKIINDDDRGFMGLPNVPNTNYGLNLGINYKGLLSVRFCKVPPAIISMLAGDWPHPSKLTCNPCIKNAGRLTKAILQPFLF